MDSERLESKMSNLYWWLRFGPFSPGEGILPHMGEVIAHYRKKRGYRTQADFAIAAGVTLRTVQEWETSIMTHDHERRIFLAKLLKVPVALLGLDWRLVVYQDNLGTQTNPMEHLTHLIEEDTYYHYEDTLLMGWACLRKGDLPHFAERVTRRLRKLQTLVRQAPESEKEAWQSLLCQYYQLAEGYARHSGMSKGQKNQAVAYSTAAIQLATDLEHVELLGSALFRDTQLHVEHGNYDLARKSAQGAMGYIDRVRSPLKGNIYLVAADVNAHYAAHDERLRNQCRQWQDKAANLVYKGNLEDDGTFLKLNLAGVHHERAKTLLYFFQHKPQKEFLRDARTELTAAWEKLTPDLMLWRMHFYETEARIYEAEHDLEGSVRSGKEALKIAMFMQSNSGRETVTKLYHDLNAIDSLNPYVRNLSVELGIF